MPTPNPMQPRHGPWRSAAVGFLLLINLLICNGLTTLELPGHRAYPPPQTDQVLYLRDAGPARVLPNPPAANPTRPAWSNHNRSRAYGWAGFAAVAAVVVALVSVGEGIDVASGVAAALHRFSG